MVAARYSAKSEREINSGATGSRKVSPLVLDNASEMPWTALVNRGSVFFGRAGVSSAGVGEMTEVGTLGTAGDGVGGCCTTGATGVTTCFGSGFVASGSSVAGKVTEGDTVGIGLSVGVGLAALMGASVGFSMLEGVGAAEQEKDANRLVRASVHASTFPDLKAIPCWGWARLANTIASLRWLRTI